MGIDQRYIICSLDSLDCVHGSHPMVMVMVVRAKKKRIR